MKALKMIFHPLSIKQSFHKQVLIHLQMMYEVNAIPTVALYRT